MASIIDGDIRPGPLSRGNGRNRMCRISIKKPESKENLTSKLTTQVGRLSDKLQY